MDMFSLIFCLLFRTVQSKKCFLADQFILLELENAEENVINSPMLHQITFGR